MQHAVAFRGQWDGGDFGRGLRAGMVSGGHESLSERSASECKLLLYAERFPRLAQNRTRKAGPLDTI